MKYTVVWKKRALDRLAEMWLAASDKNDVTDAANQIDQLLAFEPWEHGESREKDVRVFFVPPLAVLYSISDADRLVEVLRVWRSLP
jgi:hypothetical protein